MKILKKKCNTLKGRHHYGKQLSKLDTEGKVEEEYDRDKTYKKPIMANEGTEISLKLLQGKKGRF